MAAEEKMLELLHPYQPARRMPSTPTDRRSDGLAASIRGVWLALFGFSR